MQMFPVFFLFTPSLYSSKPGQTVSRYFRRDPLGMPFPTASLGSFSSLGIYVHSITRLALGFISSFHFCSHRSKLVLD